MRRWPCCRRCKYKCLAAARSPWRLSGQPEKPARNIGHRSGTSTLFRLSASDVRCSELHSRRPRTGRGGLERGRSHRRRPTIVPGARSRSLCRRIMTLHSVRVDGSRPAGQLHSLLRGLPRDSPFADAATGRLRELGRLVSTHRSACLSVREIAEELGIGQIGRAPTEAKDRAGGEGDGGGTEGCDNRGVALSASRAPRRGTQRQGRSWRRAKSCPLPQAY